MDKLQKLLTENDGDIDMVLNHIKKNILIKYC